MIQIYKCSVRMAVVAAGGGGVMGKGHFENWGESAIADNSQQTDTSTDIDTDDKNQFNSVQNGGQVVVDSTEGSMGETRRFILRRLAQNREAARKSRLRKKLENSQLKLTQLELEHASRYSYVSGDQSSLLGGNGALAFDLEYARWLDDHQRLINDVRSAVNNPLPDNELRLLVEAVMSHYDEKFRLKSIAAKSDVFHMLSGMWKSPAERCFMWIGGFRSSELLKILGNHLEPLTDQQLMGICNLQQSSQQAEDALSQGMEALQQSLVGTPSVGFTSSGNVAVSSQVSD
ncbi:putative transcription factor bZIP family [Helianthus anomalus]